MVNFLETYFGLQLWIWLLIVIGLLYYWYLNNNNEYSNSNNNCITNKISDEHSHNHKSKPKIKVYNFNTTWCGWSQKFQPEWNLFSNQIIQDPMLANIDAFDIKCEGDNESMCDQYKVPGFPYIVIEHGDQKTPYKGPRTSGDLLEFIKNNY